MTDSLTIPKRVKAFTWFLIVAGLFFGYVYTWNPGLAFPGTTIDSYSSQFAFASVGVRVIASVIALIISLLLNNPRFLIITLVSRVCIEFGDVLVGLLVGGSTVNTIGLSVLGVFEIIAIVSLYKHIYAKKI